jgi:hypothetical protein
VALKPRIRWPIIDAMNIRETGIAELQAEVDIDPYDPFLRCNLACALGSIGDYQSAFQHLGAAMEHADGAIAAGCVSLATPHGSAGPSARECLTTGPEGQARIDASGTMNRSWNSGTEPTNALSDAFGLGMNYFPIMGTAARAEYGERTSPTPLCR